MKLVEHTVSMPIRHPDTGRRLYYMRDGKRKYLTYMGKLDLYEDGVVFDWKSAASPEEVEAQKQVDFQMELYALALMEEGLPVTEAVYRVIGKPTIRLKRNESVEEYEARCIAWMRERGDQVCMEVRRPIADARLHAASTWLYRNAKSILASRKDGYWNHNSQACFAYRRKCPHHQLCRALTHGWDVQSLIDSDYTTKETHPELGINDADVVTYSTASTRSLCAMKHFWRKELGLVRRDDNKDSEALVIGSAMHAVVEGLKRSGIDEAMRLLREFRESQTPFGPKETAKLNEQCAKGKAMALVAAERWAT